MKSLLCSSMLLLLPLSASAYYDDNPQNQLYCDAEFWEIFEDFSKHHQSLIETSTDLTNNQQWGGHYWLMGELRFNGIPSKELYTVKQAGGGWDFGFTAYASPEQSELLLDELVDAWQLIMVDANHFERPTRKGVLRVELDDKGQLNVSCSQR